MYRTTGRNGDGLVCVAMATLIFHLMPTQLPDGANTILIGQLSADEERLALIGGNCAIQGLNYEGHDKYWTVKGDLFCPFVCLMCVSLRRLLETMSAPWLS